MKRTKCTIGCSIVLLLCAFVALPQTPPVTIGDVLLFDSANYNPHNVFAYALAGSPGVFGAYDPTGTFYAGFTAPTLTSNKVWTLPSADLAGCLSSDGFFHLSFTTCGGGGSTGGSAGGISSSIQYNQGSGVFGGDANLTWNSSTRQMSVSGTAGAYTLLVYGGWLQSNGGFVSNNNNYQGFNTATDGAVLRGISVLPAVSNVTGGYVNFSPLGYGNQPVPLPGLSAFPAHTPILWASGTNAATADTTFGLNTNVYINAAGGFATLSPAFNSTQAPSGGMLAKSFTATAYLQSGHSSGPPVPTLNDGFGPGALYYDEQLNLEQVYDGTSWRSLTTGGGGTVGGANKSVQFNSSGSFAGSANFQWDNTARLLTVTTPDSTTAGIAVANGFVQSDGGFVATPATATLFNSIQAPAGGMSALSFTAINYIQSGNSNGPPTPTTNDGFAAGALYWDTGSGSEQVFDGSAWTSLGGGTGTPGGATKAVQFNSTGTFGGSANFTWDNTARLATILALNSSSPGLAVGTGYIQSDKGFLATSGVSTNYNSIQAPTGGMFARSFTSTTYIQTGSGASDPSPTTGDGFAPGALYYSTTSTCLMLHNGASFACVGGGGSGTPGGATTNVQFNNAGSFGGSNNFTWNNTSQLLTVNGLSGTAGIAVGGGFVQSAQGFLVSVSNNFNSIQTTANGGMAARSFTATAYIQTGQFAGSSGPTPTTADGFAKGAMYWDNINNVERVFNGSTWSALTTSTSGVSSLNFLSGALSIVGTPNQVIVFPSGSSITLSTPQNLNSTANVIFATAQTLTFTSTQTGTGTGAPSFQTANGKYVVDGAGNLSLTGALALNGSSGTGAGLNIPNSTDTNSIQTAGGVNVSSLGSANGVYQVHGITVINSNSTFVGAGGINTTGGGTFGAGVVATGYNIVSGFFGQNWTLTIPGGFTCAGTGCTAGTLHNIVIKGGIVVQAN